MYNTEKKKKRKKVHESRSNVAVGTNITISTLASTDHFKSAPFCRDHIWLC